MVNGYLELKDWGSMLRACDKASLLTVGRIFVSVVADTPIAGKCSELKTRRMDLDRRG